VILGWSPHPPQCHIVWKVAKWEDLQITWCDGGTKQFEVCGLTDVQENKFETIQPQIADALAQTIEIWFPDVSLAIPVKRRTLVCLGRRYHQALRTQKTAQIVYQTTFFLKIGPNRASGPNPSKPTCLVFGMDLILPASKNWKQRRGKSFISGLFRKIWHFFWKEP